MIMSETPQLGNAGKDQLDIETVAAAVKNLLYQADIPKAEFTSFLQKAVVEKRRKKKKEEKLNEPNECCQSTFEKFNCSFEDLFGTDIGTFQDNFHYFASSTTGKATDLRTLNQDTQQPVEEDNVSVSSSSSSTYFIQPPKSDTARGDATRFKELMRQRQKEAAAVTAVEQKLTNSPIKVKLRSSVKSLGRMNSPRRRTRANRADANVASFTSRSTPEIEVLSLGLMEDLSESKGSSSTDVMIDVSDQRRGQKKVVVADAKSSQGKNDRDTQQASNRSISPRRISQERCVNNKSKLQRSSEIAVRRRSESPRRRSNKRMDDSNNNDDDMMTVRSKITSPKKRTPKDVTNDIVSVGVRNKSKPISSTTHKTQSSDRSVSPRRRPSRGGDGSGGESISPRRRQRIQPEDDIKSIKSKIPSSKQTVKPMKDNETTRRCISPRRKVHSDGSNVRDPSCKSTNEKKKQCDEPTVIKNTFIKKGEFMETSTRCNNSFEYNDPMEYSCLVRKMSVRKPSSPVHRGSMDVSQTTQRKDGDRLSSSDHASSPSSRTPLTKVEPLSNSDHMTRKRMEPVNLKRRS